MTKGQWSRHDVERLLETEDLRHQDIALPHGLSTGGDDRSATARAIFSEDLTGKSVLDIGCRYGYFGFEAIRCGASRVVGLDVDGENIRKARLLADCLGVDVEFDTLDIEREPLRESFDYVLCLNILHHLKNPLGVLEKLVDATRERLVLEVASLGRHDRRKLSLSPLANRFLSRSPIVFVTQNGTGKSSIQKFFFAPQAVDHLLRCHRGVFARVETKPSEYKDRFITVAEKRRIDQLLVVAGPTSAGKRTLVRKLVEGELRDVAKRVGLDDPAAWTLTKANYMTHPSEPEIGKLLMRYDFLRPYLRSAHVHSRDEVLEVIDTAASTCFLTIWVPPEQLLQQITVAEIERRTRFGRYRGPKRRLRIQRDYRDPAKVCGHYRRWFDYTRTRSADHVVVCLDDPVRLYTVEQWESEVAPAYEGGG